MGKDILTIQVRVKGQLIPVPVDKDDSLLSIFEFIEEMFEFPREFSRLILNGRKLDLTNSTLKCGDVLTDECTVLLVASAQKDIETIRSSRADPLVKGFYEEERDDLRRRARTLELQAQSPWGSSVQHPEYRFTVIQVLFKRTVPPPYQAEKLLQKLATDPAIVQIMTERRWTVGCLCELDPKDADMEQAAKGEADSCLLGWNKNQGQRIALRLRTDDLKGFRKYDIIINTLLHELVHNVHGPHDDKFWALFGELKRRYLQLHRSLNSGRTLSASPMATDLVVGPAQSVKELPAKPSMVGGAQLSLTTEAVREKRARALESHTPVDVGPTSVVPMNRAPVDVMSVDVDVVEALPVTSTLPVVSEHHASLPKADFSQNSLSVADLDAAGLGALSSSIDWINSFRHLVLRLPEESRNVLHALVSNILSNPHDPKVRSIKTSNATLQRKLFLLGQLANQSLKHLGWTLSPSGDEWTLPTSTLDLGKLYSAKDILAVF